MSDPTTVGARALVIDPPAHPPVSAAEPPTAGALDLAGARAGGGQVAGRIEPVVLSDADIAELDAVTDSEVVAYALIPTGPYFLALSFDEATEAHRLLTLRAPQSADERRRRHSRDWRADAVKRTAAYLRHRLRHGDHVQQLARMRAADLARPVGGDPEADALADRMFAALAALGTAGEITSYCTPPATMEILARATGAVRSWESAGTDSETDRVVIRRGPDAKVQAFGTVRRRSS